MRVCLVCQKSHTDTHSHSHKHLVCVPAPPVVFEPVPVHTGTVSVLAAARPRRSSVPAHTHVCVPVHADPVRVPSITGFG